MLVNRNYEEETQPIRFQKHKQEFFKAGEESLNKGSS